MQSSVIPPTAQQLMPLPPVTLVLGGARSGKSRFAESLVQAARRDLGAPDPALYLATARIWDAEMEARIATHRARRLPDEWISMDAPDDLPYRLWERGPTPVLVDCLTLWLTAQLFDPETGVERPDFDAQTAWSNLETGITGPDNQGTASGPVVLVSNEVGLGIVPETPLGRRFRDLQGEVNARGAALADLVILTVAGIPVVVKDIRDQTLPALPDETFFPI